MTFVGLMIAAYGYWLIHYWREDVLTSGTTSSAC